nr:putative disease resistance protein [Quercus suber]
MAEAVVSVAAATLAKLLLEEGVYWSDVKDKVEELKTELIRMQCFLTDAGAWQSELATVKQGVAEMKDLAYAAQDIIEKYAHTVATRKGGGVQKTMKRCCCILDEGIAVRGVGLKIDAFKTKISNLETSFRNNFIRESIIVGKLSPLNASQRNERQTFPRLDHDVVGFDDDLNKLVEFLLREEEGNRVASICEERNEIQKLTDEEIVDKLCNFQKERKCLVILDDIWNVETWNSLSHLFPNKDTSSKVLLTSRNKEVPQSVDPRGFLHELQCLNKGRSQELLEKIAISRKEDPVTKTYMDKFGKKMIRYCGGLPLAITILGKVLATKQTQEEWEKVLKHVKSHLYEEKDLLEVNKVLALSYNDLPSNLKACFLYLGHFPRNFEIPTKEVIQMWMGEGFLSQIQHGGTRNDTMEEDVGERYIRELEQRFMVQVGKRGSLGRIKTCRIHDLMQYCCQSKVQDEKFLHTIDVFSMKQHEVSNGNIRRLSIISESGNNSLEVMNFNDYPQTLVNVQHTNIQISRELKFNCLQVLQVRTNNQVLQVTSNKRAQVAIQKLVSCSPDMNKLSLRVFIKKLPSQFSPNLAKLTLCETGLENDPMPTLERLSNLKILRLLSQSFKGKKMVCSKRGFLQLKSLVLCHLKRLEEWTVEEGALLSLCTLEIEDCKKLETIPDGLSFITTLQELKIINMLLSFKESLDEGGPDFDKVQHVTSILFHNCEQ